MERFKVSPITVTRALGVLAAEGLVVTRPGSGAYVAEPPRPIRRRPDHDWQAVALGDRRVDPSGIVAALSAIPEGAIPLVGGYLPASLQPLRALAAATGRAARRPGAWDPPPLNGLLELRTWFARQLAADPSDVLISAGGQAALTTVFRALMPAGAPVLVESPCYLGSLGTARTAGLLPVAVPADEDGVRPELLAEAFARTGARVFYCQPLFQNPTGAVLATDRRHQVLEVARAAGAFVIEDDYARLLAIEPAPPPPLATTDPHGTVIYLTSLTKPVSPSLRIAAVIARGPAAERIRDTQIVESFYPARPLQEAALELVSSPSWPRHLRNVSDGLRTRRDALTRAIAAHLPNLDPPRIPQGGMHLWVRLPNGIDDMELAARARHNGVIVSPGRPFFPAEPSGPHLRLAYTAAAIEDLDEAVLRLAASF